MNARDALTAALKSVGRTQKEAAESVGWTSQQITNRLLHGTLRADSFLEIMDLMGVDVKFVNRQTGREIHLPVDGRGRRVVGMVNSVTYDTAKSDSIANNFLSDGGADGMAMELYIDRDGRYFFACYSNVEGVKDRIVPVSAGDAAVFIRKYATSLGQCSESNQD